jgi:soluble lytic murein transglycosylase-like protein
MSAGRIHARRGEPAFRAERAARSVALLTATVLSTSISCAVFLEPVRAPSPAGPAAAKEAFGPTAVEWVAGHFTRYRTRLAPFEIRTVAEAIVSESLAHDLDLELVLSLIRTESGFDNFATSHVGALGLMQVMPRTGEYMAERLGIDWEGPEDLFDPVTNVRIGTAYLARLHKRYAGNWADALAAYNWGPARVDYRLARGRALPAAYFTKVLDGRSIFDGIARP